MTPKKISEKGISRQYPLKFEILVLKGRHDIVAVEPTDLGALGPLKDLFAHGHKTITVGPSQRGFTYNKIEDQPTYKGRRLIYQR